MVGTSALNRPSLTATSQAVPPARLPASRSVNRVDAHGAARDTQRRGTGLDLVEDQVRDTGREQQGAVGGGAEVRPGAFAEHEALQVEGRDQR